MTTKPSPPSSSSSSDNDPRSSCRFPGIGGSAMLLLLVVVIVMELATPRGVLKTYTSLAKDTSSSSSSSPCPEDQTSSDDKTTALLMKKMEGLKSSQMKILQTLQSSGVSRPLNSSTTVPVSNEDLKNSALADGRTIDDTTTCRDLLRDFHLRNALYKTGSAGAPAPLYHYGKFIGQGFGRVIEHSCTTCILAMTLGRPCVIDLSTRDEHYTWRSFINTGSYDWEIRGRVEQYQRDVYDLIKQMPPPHFEGHGMWEDETFEKLPHQEKIYAIRAPADLPRNPDFWEWTQKLWREPTVRDDQLLLVPNWGFAWFSKLVPPNKIGQCNNEHLLTQIQNAMFRPTAMARHLHQQRVQKLLPNATEPFGSIHIRMMILNEGKKKRDIFETDYIRDRLVNCTDPYKEKVRNWWILADEPEIAQNISEDVPQFYQAYTSLEDDFMEKNVHSLSSDATKIYGHESMAPSVLDWMVLHESTVAMITTGAYGATGARGNGKTRQHSCQPFLQVYFASERS